MELLVGWGQLVMSEVFNSEYPRLIHVRARYDHGHGAEIFQIKLPGVARFLFEYGG